MRSSAIASLPRCGWQIVCTRKRIRSEREIEVLFVTAAAAASSAGAGPKRVRLGGLHACVCITRRMRAIALPSPVLWRSWIKKKRRKVCQTCVHVPDTNDLMLHHNNTNKIMAHMTHTHVYTDVCTCTLICVYVCLWE